MLNRQTVNANALQFNMRIENFSVIHIMRLYVFGTVRILSNFVIFSIIITIFLFLFVYFDASSLYTFLFASCPIEDLSYIKLN
jgi:hypothetical protein